MSRIDAEDAPTGSIREFKYLRRLKVERMALPASADATPCSLHGEEL
jgi:hypothetical protein